MEPYNDDSTIFPATLSKFSIFPLGDNRVLLTGPGIYPQIYHRTPFPEVIICKRFKWKLKEGWDHFEFYKWIYFFMSYDNQVLLRVISHKALLLAPSKKSLPLPFSLAKKRMYLDPHLKEELTDLFQKLSGCFLFTQPV